MKPIKTYIYFHYLAVVFKIHTSTSDFLFVMFIHHLYNNLQTEYQSKYTLGDLALTPNESNLPL